MHYHKHRHKLFMFLCFKVTFLNEFQNTFLEWVLSFLVLILNFIVFANI